MNKIVEQIQEVLRPYPGLSLDTNTLVATGRLTVDENDYFEIEIDFWPWYNTRFPFVLEVGGRIPRVKERHIYEDKGNCCLTTRFMEFILIKSKVPTLHVFMREILIPYFQRQSLYEILGRYENELDHGVPGILQSYGEFLGTDDLNIIIQLMQDRVDGKKPSRNDRCYCGKQKLKRCHEREYELFRMVPLEIINVDLIRFVEWRNLLIKISA